MHLKNPQTKAKLVKKMTTIRSTNQVKLSTEKLFMLSRFQRKTLTVKMNVSR